VNNFYLWSRVKQPESKGRSRRGPGFISWASCLFFLAIRCKRSRVQPLSHSGALHKDPRFISWVLLLSLSEGNT